MITENWQMSWFLCTPWKNLEWMNGNGNIILSENMVTCQANPVCGSFPGPMSCRCPSGLLETPPRWHATIYNSVFGKRVLLLLQPHEMICGRHSKLYIILEWDWHFHYTFRFNWAWKNCRSKIGMRSPCSTMIPILIVQEMCICVSRNPLNV